MEHDEDQPCDMWRLGRVERLIEGVAVVKVGSKNKRSAIAKHPIQRLFLWEVNDQEQPTGPVHREKPASHQQLRQNPRKAAAL